MTSGRWQKGETWEWSNEILPLLERHPERRVRQRLWLWTGPSWLLGGKVTEMMNDDYSGGKSHGILFQTFKLHSNGHQIIKDLDSIQCLRLHNVWEDPLCSTLPEFPDPIVESVRCLTRPTLHSLNRINFPSGDFIWQELDSIFYPHTSVEISGL